MMPSYRISLHFYGILMLKIAEHSFSKMQHQRLSQSIRLPLLPLPLSLSSLFSLNLATLSNPPLLFQQPAVGVAALPSSVLSTSNYRFSDNCVLRSRSRPTSCLHFSARIPPYSSESCNILLQYACVWTPSWKLHSPPTHGGDNSPCSKDVHVQINTHMQIQSTLHRVIMSVWGQMESSCVFAGHAVSRRVSEV